VLSGMWAEVAKDRLPSEQMANHNVGTLPSDYRSRPWRHRVTTSSIVKVFSTSLWIWMEEWRCTSAHSCRPFGFK